MGTLTNILDFYKPIAHESNYEGTLNPNWDKLDILLGSDAVNAMDSRFGAVGDGASDDRPEIQAALDYAATANNKTVVLPKSTGSYVLADGATLTIPTGVSLVGENPGVTISAKNAYALTIPASGSGFSVRNLTLSLRTGSTTGGAVKCTAGGIHADIDFSRVTGIGVSTLTQPVWNVQGLVGCTFTYCHGNGGPVGFYCYTGGSSFFNIVTFNECRAANATNANTFTGVHESGINAGFFVEDGSLVRVVGCTLESNYNGYGFVQSGSGATVLDGNWFEANKFADVYFVSDGASKIQNNRFSGLDAGGPAGASLIKLREPIGAGRYNHTVIRDNNIVNTPTSGYSIDIGTNVEDTVIADNRGYNVSTTLNNGTRTTVHDGNVLRLGGPLLTSGSGSPEGNLVGAIGSIYMRTDGGAGTSIYVKQSGAGNTGWVGK